MNGKTTDPQLSTIIAIADAYGCTLDWLCGRTEDGRGAEVLAFREIAQIVRRVPSAGGQ